MKAPARLPQNPPASSGESIRRSTGNSRSSATVTIRLLEWVLVHRGITAGAFMVFALASFGLVAIVGQNFFPYVDAGQMRLHVRPPTGTRIEEAAIIFASIENEIRRVIPADELDTILDNIGLPEDSGIKEIWPSAIP